MQIIVEITKKEEMIVRHGAKTIKIAVEPAFCACGGAIYRDYIRKVVREVEEVLDRKINKVEAALIIDEALRRKVRRMKNNK